MTPEDTFTTIYSYSNLDTKPSLKIYRYAYDQILFFEVFMSLITKFEILFYTKFKLIK